jgi:hypothetical protein
LWLLGFELKDFVLVRQVLYHWSHSSGPFSLVVLEIGTYFFAQAGPTSSCFMLPAGWDDSMCHYAHRELGKMGSHKLFCPGWLRSRILPISASQVARIIGISHQHLASIGGNFKQHLKMLLNWLWWHALVISAT